MKSKQIAITLTFFLCCIALLYFVGCSGGGSQSNTNDPDIASYSSNSITLKGKFNMTGSLLPSPSFAPDHSILPPYTRILLYDLKNKKTLGTTYPGTDGSFLFDGDYRGLCLSLQIENTSREIIIGNIPKTFPLNIVLNLSAPLDSTGGFDEHALISSNIIKNLNIIDTMSADATNGLPDLWNTMRKTKDTVTTYMQLNPQKKLKDIVTDSMNGQSDISQKITTSLDIHAGPLDHFIINSDGPKTSGSDITLTVIAKDASNMTVINYAGAGRLSLINPNGYINWTGTGITSSGSSGAVYSGSAFINGTAIVKISSSVADSSKTVTITDDATSKTGSGTVTWTETPPAPVGKILDHFEITSDSPQPNNSKITLKITAKDNAGLVVTSYSGNGTLTIANPSGTITWLGNGVKAVTNGNATYSSGNFTSGVFFVQVTDTAIETSKTFTVTDTASGRYGTASLSWTQNSVLDHFDISPVSSPQTAGVPFQITLTAKNSLNETLLSHTTAATLSDTTNSISPKITGSFVNGVWAGNITLTTMTTDTKITATTGLISVASNSIVVNPGIFSKLSVVQQPSAASMAGTIFAQQPKVSINDAYGNLITGDNSTVITASRGSIGTATLQGTLTAKAVNGIATFTNLSYNKAENLNINFSSGSATTTESNTIAVSATSMNHFEISSDSPKTLGTSITLTVTAKDMYGNNAASYNSAGTLSIAGTTGTISWSGQGVSSGGTYSVNTFVSGIGIISVVNSAADSNKILTITDTATNIKGTVSVSWQVQALDHFEISNIASPKNAGAQFSVTITAKDASNVIVSSFSGTTSISDTTNTISPNQTGNFINGLWTGNVTITKAQSNINIVASSNGKSGTSNNFSVSPGPFNRFNFVISSPQRGDGGPFTGVNTLTAVDSLNNPITDFNVSSTGSITILITSGPAGTISGLGSGNILAPSDFVSGVANLTGKMKFTTSETGTRKFGAGVGTYTGGQQAGYTFTPYGTSNDVNFTDIVPEFDHFNFVISSPQKGDGTPFTGINTVTAVDKYNNVVTNFNTSFTNNIAIKLNSGPSGTISGIGTGYVLVPSDFVNGVANLTGKMKFLTSTLGIRKFDAGVELFTSGQEVGYSFTSYGTSNNVDITTVGIVYTSDFTFYDNGTNLTITAYSGAGSTLTVPASYNGKTVAGIADQIFMNSTNSTSLTSATIPGSISNIGALAFSGGSGLTSITVDNANQNYSNDANGVLYNKNKTALIFYPIGKSGAFTVPSSVTSIGDNAFAVTGITGITLSANLVSIGKEAFSGCSSLSSITLPGSVTSIGDSAFASTGIISITIPNGVTNIGNYTFSSCAALTSITMQGNITSIGNYAFSSTSLTSITIPNSVMSIGNFAFAWCNSLTSVTVPNNVASIGIEAFYNCNSLTNITVDNANQNYSSDASGVLYNKNKTMLIQFPKGKSGTFTIPGSVTSVGDYAFYACTGLTSISLPTNLSNIGANALYGCNNLASVTIPNGVITIGNSAFKSCTKLASAYFNGNAPTTFGADVFKSCASGFKIYYSVGRTGWTNPWNSYTTATF